MTENQPALNLSAALDRIDGDHELFLTLAGMFVERAKQDLEAIRMALAKQDRSLLAQAAHRIKGSALEFCAHPTVAAATQLEESARQPVARELATLCEDVEAEVQRLTAALKAIMENGLRS